LQTVNTELKLKLEAISRAHSDLQNLLAATDFGTLFLDSSLRIKRFTERATELFSITPSDEGRPISDFSHQLEYDDLIQDTRKVLSDLAPIRREIRSCKNLWYDVRMRPYRTVDNKIDGVVITFVDITERRHTEQALRDSERQLHQQKRLVELSRAPIFVWELDGGIVEWNRGCEELYGYSRQEALGRRKELLLKTEVPGSLFTDLTKELREDGVWSGEVVHHAKDGRTLAIEAQLEFEPLDGRQFVLESTRDITDQKAWAERQHMLRRDLTHRLKNMFAVVQLIAHQTMRTHPSLEEFAASFDGRLAALGRANSLLSESDWESADLAELVRSLLAPYAPEGSARYRLEGEPLLLSVDIASPFGLVLHELATNAAEYGSLSRAEGTISIKWSVKSAEGHRVLEFIWEEQGGPAPVAPPSRSGVGSVLIENAIPNAVVNTEFRRGGLVCTVRVPI
jgi:two-component system CheB/CheR fusion protein